MAKVTYQQGDWFAVPLTTGGYGVGVIARSNPRAALLGYFFGPRRGVIPSIDDVATLRPADAVLVGRFGHLGLKTGRWPNFGRTEGWDRGMWGMPVFGRYEELTGRSFMIFYADDDPGRLIREEQVRPGDIEHAPKDGLMGAEFTEIKLTKLLGGLGYGSC